MHRYPEDTEVSPDDALAALEEHAEAVMAAKECTALWQTLSAAAAKEAEAASWSKAKALWLVADCCSMLLRPDSTNEPFAPAMVTTAGRSLVLDDLGPADIELVAGIASRTTSSVLRARLSDIAWLCRRPRRNIDDALRAIDAYTDRPLTEDDWFLRIKEWERAVVLCRLVRQAAANRLQRIETQLIDAANAGVPRDGGLGSAVARLLLSHQLAEDDQEHFANLLATRGRELVLGKQFHRGRSFLAQATGWYGKLDDSDSVAQLSYEQAMSFEAEADDRLGNEATGALVAQGLLNDAIQLLRQIPKAFRERHGVEGHLERIQLRLSEVGLKALKSMVQFKTDPVDIRDIVAQSEAAVRGKLLGEALLALANISRGVDLAKLRSGAQQVLRDYPLGALFGATHLGMDGRVLASTPPSGSGEGESAEYDNALMATMMRHYRIEVDLVCKGMILPAMRVIAQEHRISKAELEQVMAQSPIVPPRRALQFAKGIFEGLEQDYSTALHILAPQVENLVRVHLKRADLSTTTVDREGIENEVGLSALIENHREKLDAMFGADLVFELQALFCNPLSGNLRNQVAHGLLDDHGFDTTDAVYAWWLVLRITFNTFWNRASKGAARSSPTPEPDQQEQTRSPAGATPDGDA